MAISTLQSGYYQKRSLEMNNINISEVLSALTIQRCDDYDTWLKVGMALFHEGYGCDVWDSWSQKSSKYKSGECQKKWNTFATSSAQVGVGSIVQMAKDDGYKITKDTYLDNGSYSEKPNNSIVSANIELKRYLQAVFKGGDIINYVVNSFEKDGKWLPYGKGVNQSLDSLVRACDKYEDISYVLGDWKLSAGAWVRFNPMNGSGVKNSDVVEFRHCLIESDSLSKAEQLAKIKELNLPCSAIVDSGGKSIHAIVRIDAGTDEKVYKDRVQSLHTYLEQHNFPVDKACKNASRLSRLAGVTRDGKRQHLIATNIGAKSYEDWEQNYKETPIDYTITYASHMRKIDPEDLSDNILGQRFLTRFGSWLIIAQSGIGKSVLAMQLALHFTLGKSVFGIPTQKPLKVLFIQAENNDIDLARPFHSVSNKANFTPEENALIDKNLVFISEESSSGDKFISMFDSACKKLSPDLVIIDPLLSYIGGDISRQDVCSIFLRNKLNPMIKKHNVGVVIIHHTGKPPKDVSTNAGNLGNNLSYLGIGSSELTNWARAVSVIQQNQDENKVFEFVHTKRGKLSCAKETTYLKHADEGVYWVECNAPISKESNEDNEYNKQQKVYKYDYLDLDKMPKKLHNSDPNKSEVLLYIRQKLSECGDDDSVAKAIKVFESIRKYSKKLVFRTPYWYGSTTLMDEDFENAKGGMYYE